MNENVKKGLLGAVIALAIGVAIFEGMTMMKEPALIKGNDLGHGTPGHGMKAAEQEEARKGAANQATQTAPPVDPLAGGTPPPPGGK